jgi:predicted PurR-regulated permease PerM
MSRLAPHVAAVAAVVLALAGGLWLWAGAVAPGYRSSIALGIAWCVLVLVVAGRIGRRLPDLRRTLRVTTLACAAVLIVGTYLTSIRETTVDEPLVQGAPASSLDAAELEREVGDDPLAPQP